MVDRGAPSNFGEIYFSKESPFMENLLAQEDEACELDITVADLIPSASDDSNNEVENVRTLSPDLSKQPELVEIEF
jgi:hypothetical protein